MRYNCYLGWLLDPEARPTFAELETMMEEFLSDPLRYILTVVRHTNAASIPLLLNAPVVD